MGILSNTVSICHFQVIGELPAGDLFDWASERLARNAFHPIDQSAEELSLGWAHLDDQRQFDFATPAAFWRDHYVTFTMRRDQRRLPAALVKAYVQVAEHEYLEANPGLQRIAKQKREELRETVKLSLLARTLPVPSTCDAVWDTRTGIVTFASLSAKNIEEFEALFKKTFDGLRLVAFHPYSRACQVGGDSLRPELEKANLATSDAVLSLIRDNQWLGWDFFLWLMYRTMNDSSSYRVTIPGHANADEPFIAYLDDRLVLAGGGDNGLQKITVAGSQDSFSEVRTALRGGKKITEATLYLEKDELTWKATLKGEMFHFGSFRAPSVKIEKDDTTDQGSEREAVFYERMYVLEQGLQLFDSLYAAFLAERLDSGWEASLQKIGEWLGPDQP